LTPILPCLYHLVVSKSVFILGNVKHIKFIHVMHWRLWYEYMKSVTVLFYVIKHHYCINHIFFSLYNFDWGSMQMLWTTINYITIKYDRIHIAFFWNCCINIFCLFTFMFSGFLHALSIYRCVGVLLCTIECKCNECIQCLCNMLSW